jgi:hypothetical protein
VVEKALKLADEVLAKEYAPRLEIAKELRRLHSENEQLKAREWVGLTDEEIDYFIGSNSRKKSLCKAIESYLKDKNT